MWFATHQGGLLTSIGDEAILIFLVHAVLEDLLDLIVAQCLSCKRKLTISFCLTNQRILVLPLTQSQHVVLQLSQEHQTVLVLVVQLQALQEVLVAALVLVLLDLGEDGQELLNSQLLLSALLAGAHLLAQGQSGVQVQGAKHITDLGRVDGALTLHIEDGESELSP